METLNSKEKFSETLQDHADLSMNGTGSGSQVDTRLTQRSSRKVPKKGWVYFIDAGEAIKIGFASVVTERLNALQISTHNNLTLLAQVPGDRLLESQYHDRFRPYLIRGEWFEGDAEPILQEIDRINGILPELKPSRPQRTIDVAADVGRLIKQRKQYRGQIPIYERFSTLIQAVREWSTADFQDRLGLTRQINHLREGLRERGVTV